MECIYLRTGQEPGTVSVDLVTLQVKALWLGLIPSALNPRKLIATS